jgi:hypothetical protein
MGGARGACASGVVRCGACGWLIEKEHHWQLGGDGLEHVECEHEPPMPPRFTPRIWSQNWWGRRSEPISGSPHPIAVVGRDRIKRLEHQAEEPFWCVAREAAEEIRAGD